MGDAFAFVLHSHLPYARGAGRWPHGEEWVHEAILGTYLPILVALHDLRDERVRFKLTIGLTPALIEQLADPDIIARSFEYIDDQIVRAERDITRSEREGASALGGLAEFYRSHYRSLRDAYAGRFGSDIVGAFADLARSGHLELLTSAATHGYLPLLDESSVNGQLAVGRRSSRRVLGLDPSGMWLPECAYRPGLERSIQAHGITHFFSDAALLLGREAVPAGRLVRFGRERDRSGAGIADREVASAALGEVDVFRAYLVADSDVAVIARHPEVSGQVWSAMHGFPGDPAYREFHRKDADSGLRYWKITGSDVDLGQKALYDVHSAFERVSKHADHYAWVIRQELEAHRGRTGRDGLLTVTFDSELFGHWWFEGVTWLAEVLRRLAAGGPPTTTIADHLEARPPLEHLPLREGSWGKDNDHSTWYHEGTEWMWRDLDAMARRFAEVRAAPPSDPLRARAARQAARELLLAQSSDWPFLVTTAQAADYAIERFRAHALRFNRCCELARRGGEADETEIGTLERADNVFPEIDLQDFEVLPSS